MRKSVSVVIPNFNGESLLEQNLPSVYRALERAGVAYEIIVPDDASTDNSVAFLKAHYPDILVVESSENGGFSINTNRGIWQASQELVLILNSDIELTDAYFQDLFRYFADSRTFGVTGRIIGMASDTIQDAAKYPECSFTRIRGTRNFLVQDPLPAGEWVPSFFLTGANALLDRQKLLELGGYCALFSPYYSEDTELGIRAWRLGYRCYYEHAAVCRHPLSATISKYSTRRKVSIIGRRNKMYLHFLHLNGLALGVWFALTFFKFVFRGLLFDSKYRAAFLAFWRTLPQAREAKRDFAQLQEQHQGAISVQDVCREIKSWLKNYRFVRF
jgi:GT2 family glycosyltransferase